MSKIPTESEEQIRFVQWLKRHHPGVKFFAIPNGGVRNKRTAAILKAEGVSPGVPDLFFPGLFLFIEMKRQRGGVTSQAQRSWFAELESHGYRCELARGCEEAKTKFLDNLSRLGLLNSEK